MTVITSDLEVPVSDCPTCGNPMPQSRCHVCGYAEVETAEEKRSTETTEAPRAKRKS